MFERRFPFLISVAVIVLIVMPYLYAFQMNNPVSVFCGFLINPVDGFSYLAKMQQGFYGEWKFVLPFTAEPGSGAYLFLFYLGLGHLSRILNLPLLVVFHSARIFGAILLLGTLYIFNKKFFEERRHQNLSFAICVLGSGLGWIAVFTGLFTSDFWVAEAYPFLSMYTNPHFSIGLALMVVALMPERKPSAVWELALGLVLGIIQPFAVVIVLIVRVGQIIIGIIGEEKQGKRFIDLEDFVPVIAFALGGGLVLIYQYWSILSDPILSLWNDQNITESPGIVDILISFSPCLILAGLGIKNAWQTQKGRRLVIWSVVSLVLAIIPWNLQRRFLTGIYIPIAGLAVYGLMGLERNRRFSYRSSVIMLLVLAIPTNIIILASGIMAASKQDPSIFQSREIYKGLAWIMENTSSDALVLTDEDTGLLIPPITGRRVIYGHPFETINAKNEKEFLQSFLNEKQDDLTYDKYIADRGIDVLFISREISVDLNEWINDNGFKTDYENTLVRIYLIGQ